MKAAYFQGHVELLGLSPTGAPGPTAADADEVEVPDRVTTIDELATASGVPAADIRSKNPGLASGGDLTAGTKVQLPGCRLHVVVADAEDPAHVTAETPAMIARQHGIAVADLERSNPGITAATGWAQLTAGQRVLIPRH